MDKEQENLATEPASQGTTATEGAVFKGSFSTTQRGTDETHLLSTCLKQPWPFRKRALRYLSVGWTDTNIWKCALIEAVGTMSLCYLSGLMDVTFGAYGIYVPNWVGITNVILLSLLILATAPSSGGHLNPLITFATITTGLTELSRGILYMIFQLIGASVAGGLVRGSFGSKIAEPGRYNGGGCFFYASSGVSVGQAFLIETISSFVLLFLAFGVALDPKQAHIMGPVLGPVLVGTSLGLVSFASAGIAVGYAGAGMNPARCFAFGVARNGFQYQWIWWVGPFCGALLATTIYLAVPPYRTSKKQ